MRPVTDIRILTNIVREFNLSINGYLRKRKYYAEIPMTEPSIKFPEYAIEKCIVRFKDHTRGILIAHTVKFTTVKGILILFFRYIDKNDEGVVQNLNPKAIPASSIKSIELSHGVENVEVVFNFETRKWKMKK